MVSLNELKPNNLLSDPSHAYQIVKLLRINIYDGNEGRVEETGDEIYSYEVDLRTLNPIPLTGELLEKIGLKKRFNEESCNIWDMKESVTRNKVFSLALISDGWIYMAAPGAIPFHHLHQLQNLYFALCGIELKIDNLTK